MNVNNFIASAERPKNVSSPVQSITTMCDDDIYHSIYAALKIHSQIKEQRQFRVCASMCTAVGAAANFAAENFFYENPVSVISKIGMESIFGSAAIFAAGLCITRLGELFLFSSQQNLLVQQANLFDDSGKIKNIVDSKKESLIENSMKFCENFDEAIIKDWCEEIFKKSAVPPTQKQLDRALKKAIFFDKIQLAKMLIAHGADKYSVLQVSGLQLKFALKQRKANFKEWEALIPSFCNLLKRLARLKTLSHILDVPIHYGLFKGSGWCSWESARVFKKIYLQMRSEGLLSTHNEFITQTIASVLNDLIERADVSRHIAHESEPIIMDVGFAGDDKKGGGHAIYLCLYEDVFIYADTGTLTTSEFFQAKNPVVIGRFKRNEFSMNKLNALLAVKNLKQDEHKANIFECLKALDYKDVVSIPSYYQRTGSCTYTALAACISTLAVILQGRLHKSMEEIFSGPFLEEQSLQFLTFPQSVEKYLISHSKVFDRSFFASKASLAPFAKAIYERAEEERITTLSDKYVSAKHPSYVEYLTLKEKALKRLSSLIEEDEILSQVS
jgi:hypothetical protein